jgi:hypothetical protein
MLSILIAAAAIAAVFTPLQGFTQPPDTLWTRTYGGYSQDKAYSVQQTSDGGDVLGGATQSFGAGNWDFYLVKTDANGTAQWTHTYGGVGLDFCYCAQQTADGGYMLAGYTASYGAGSYDFYLVKTDASGNPLWTRTYGGIGQEYCYSAQQTTDGGFILAGCTFSSGAGSNDYYLVKTDSLGNAVWTHTYGTSGTEEAYGVQQTSDGGYIAAGFSAPFGNNSQRVWLVKTNTAGDTLWTRWYDGPGYDYAMSIQQTSDGGYAAFGRTNSYGAGDYDFYLIKTNSNGDSVWARTYGGIGIDQGFAVDQTSDNGYILTGYTTSFGAGGWDYYLVRTDATGNALWTVTYGGISTDEGRSVLQTSDGGFVVAGNTGSFGAGSRDYYLVRLASEAAPAALNVTMTPINPPINIPANGGSFQFNATVQRTQAPQAAFYAWARNRYPNGTYSGNLLGPVNINPPVGVTVTRTRTQVIDAGWLAGANYYIGYANNSVAYPAIDADSFLWTKLTTYDGGPMVWEVANYGEEFPYQVGGSSTPTSFALIGASPNPFNPTTTLTFSLPEAVKVALNVYDVQGRLVAALVNGFREAGNHQVTFYGSNLVSGVYLYTLKAGGHMAKGKMVLLK